MCEFKNEEYAQGGAVLTIVSTNYLSNGISGLHNQIVSQFPKKNSISTGWTKVILLSAQEILICLPLWGNGNNRQFREKEAIPDSCHLEQLSAANGTDSSNCYQLKTDWVIMGCMQM